MLYNYQSFQRDLPTIVERLRGRKPEGITSMSCCCPKMWAIHLAKLLDVPYIEFNQRTGKTIELKVYTGDAEASLDLGLRMCYAVFSSRKAQGKVLDFLHGSEIPLSVSNL